MKKYFLVLVWLLFGTVAFGQNYHITDFIPDSLRTWQVYGTISTSLSGTDRDDVRKKTGVNETKDYSDESTVGITPTVYFKYWQVTPQREFSVYSYLKGSISRDYDGTHSEDILSNITSEEDRTLKNLDGQIYGSVSWAEYMFCRNRLGLSLEAYIALVKSKRLTIYENQYQGSNSDGITNEDTDRLYSTPMYRLSPGVVFGRIYNGNYAAKAEEIIAELQKQNLLIRDLTAAEFQEFSQRILNRTTAYHYDSRLKNIEALQDIIGYLESVGVLKELDIASFVTINDVYLFSPARNTRSFGTQFYFRSNFRYSPSIRNYNSDYWQRNWYVNNGVFEHDSLTTNYKRFMNDEIQNQSHSSGYEIGFNRYIVKSWHLWYNYGAYFNHTFTPTRYTYKNKRETEDILNDTI